MTANDILTDKKACVGFFDDLYTTGLIRPTTSETVKGIFENGIKFLFDSYSYSYIIDIAETPNSGLNFERVWLNNEWTKPGPWEKHIVIFIENYLNKIKEAKEGEIARAIREQARRQEEFEKEQVLKAQAEEKRIAAWK